MFVYAANCTVKGLSFQRFPWVGLALLYPDAHHNTIRGCWFGLDYSGAISAPNYQGIFIFSGASSNTIGGTTTADRNVLSGNAQYGVWISGANTTGNIVLGNYIGTGASGSAAAPNGFGGLIVTDSSHDNTIGGTLSGARNVISGNVDAGVWLTGAGVNNNMVRGNYIGLAATDAAAVPNTFAGLYIINGASDNLVADNVISGNTAEGLRLADAGSSGNVVQGNRVGTAPDGGTAIGNGFAGVAIRGGAQSNTIGGTAPGARNIVSGNGSDGISISDSGTTLNVIEGNYIGLDVTGLVKIASGFAGVDIFNGAQANTIGGTTAGARNFISGSDNYGVAVTGIGTNSNLIQGNTIGLNVAGAPIANGFHGVALFQASPADPSGPQFNIIGGSAVGASNIIAGNTGQAVALFDPGTIKNTISGNSIFSNGGGISLISGANNSQAAPTLNSPAVLSSATNPNGTDVSGSLTSIPSTTFRVEFFASPSGGNQGKFFVGATSATTSGAGTVNFSAPLPAVVPAGFVLTATATSPIGNTSQFSNAQTVTTTDANGDGLPDNYENAHPGVTGANADFDGDGLTNLQEFTAGTNPKNAASRFAISSIDRMAGNPRINFQAMAGKTYRFEYRDDLVTGNWSTLVDQIFSPGTATLQIIDPSAAGLPERFYRLAIEP